MNAARRFGGLPALVAGLLLAAGALYLTAVQPATGVIEGTVVAEETGDPISGARVRIAPAGRGENEACRSVRSDAAGTFRLAGIPVGYYDVSATGKARRLGNVRVEIVEARPTRLDLQLSPQAPGFDLVVHQRMFCPDEKAEVACKGFVLSPTLRVQCFRVDPLALERDAGGSLRQFLGLGWDDKALQNADLSAQAKLTTLPPREEPITTRDAEGVFYQRVYPVLSGPGLYMVSIEADGVRRLTWLAVTELGLITKQAGRRLLVYATHLRTGRPIAGCRLSLLSAAMALPEAVTSATGLADIALPREVLGGELLVAGRYGKSFAVINAYPYADEDGPHVVYTYTDRPVYRPGDTVSFKGIVRRTVEGGYRVPAGTNAGIEVHDDAQNQVYSTQLRTNARGSFHGSLTLPKTAGSGRYSLTVSIEGKPYFSGFDVAAYRKPEYKVQVTTDRPWYVKGDSITATVAAEYYFGAPVANAKVNYSVRVAPMWYDPSEGEPSEGAVPEDEPQYAESGEWISSGEAMTDAAGHATVRIGTRMPAREEAEAEDEGWGLADAEEYDRRFTVEAVVTDPARHEVTGSGTVRVARGEFNLTLTADRVLLAEGATTPVTINALDHDGKPVGGAAVEVEAGPFRWTGDVYTHDVRLKERLTTDAAGRATLQARPDEPGEYRIVATARDTRGNRIARSLVLWAMAEGEGDYDYKYPKLELVADKKVYEEGDTATVLVNTDHAGADALICIEGKDLYQAYTQRLARRSTTLRVPLYGRYVPGVYLSVSYVRDKEFVSDTKRLAIATRRKELTVEVKPSKETLAPGERIRYDLRTLNAAGRPAPAEVSLAVVNEAVFAIRPEPKPDIIGAFYPPVESQVRTDFSFPQVYLSPEEKGGRPTEVRERFRDTAHWAPTVITGADGRGSVEFALPDDLASWRATARAHTAATEVGTGRATVTSRKPLMVRLVLPRFVTQGDRCRVGAVVHNESDEPQRLQVHLETAGQPHQSSRPVSVPPGGRYSFEGEIEAPAAGSISVLGWAKADSELQDAVRVTLPVLPHGRKRLDCRSGVVRDKMATTFQVHRDAIRQHGALKLRLSPSIASAMLGSLGYLAGYPYGCTEQTLSAFLPDVAVSRMMRELHLPSSGVSPKLPDMVRDGLTRLYSYQHYDGGWGWWEDDSDDPWMTAYAVYALLEAQRAGFAVNAERLDRGLRWLQRAIGPGNVGEGVRGYALYVLALAGSRQVVARALVGTGGMGPQPVRSAHALATHALAANLIGHGELAGSYLERLWGKAHVGDGVVYWGEGEERSGSEMTSIETTAMALLATCLVRPSEARLPQVARRLMLQRQGDHWTSTRDTAMVLYAMVEYLKLSRELQPNYTARVVVNGHPESSVRMGPAMVGQPEQEVSIPLRALRTGGNRLQIGLDGDGVLYYTAELTQWIAQEDIPAVASRTRLNLTRRYYLLQPQSDPDKPPRLGKPVERVRYGDTLRCVVTLTNATQHSYMILEDYLPAGCEVIEPTDEQMLWESGDMPGNVDFFDDKVAAFWRVLPAGTHRVTYDLRATIPGDYHVMPTNTYNMYLPEIWGSGSESRLRVR